nr:unnamed protein product [Callosobruchus analis]
MPPVPTVWTCPKLLHSELQVCSLCGRTHGAPVPAQTGGDPQMCRLLGETILQMPPFAGSFPKAMPKSLLRGRKSWYSKEYLLHMWRRQDHR